MTRKNRLADATRLKDSLAAVTAAAVGVIANLTARFALQVLFFEIAERNYGPVRLYEPEYLSFDLRAAVLTVSLAC